MRTSVLSLIFAVFAVGCVSAAADARPVHDGDGPSLDQILPQIREQHPGTFYDAEGPFMGPDGRPHYRVKWMTPQGRVIWFDADARTGRVRNGEDFRRDQEFYDRPRDFDPDEDRSRGRRHRDRFNGEDGLGNPFDDGGDRPRNRHGDGDWGGGPDWRGGGDRNNRRGNRGSDGFSGGFDNQGGGGRHRGHGH